ncbi:hypothetical protein OC844_002006 [Tilletia horrida]|nr:hypothetical protein OC844_002006 [Tilletia horrida]
MASSSLAGDEDKTILVLDPFAAPADAKSRARLQALVELVIGNDHDVEHSPSGPTFTDLEGPARPAPFENEMGRDVKKDDNEETEAGYASSFSTAVQPAPEAQAHPTLGSTHSLTQWHISNRYYDADAQFACVSLPLAGPDFIPAESRSGSSLDSAQRKVSSRGNAAFEAFEKLTEGIPAIILLLADPFSKDVHEALLERIAIVRDAFEIGVSLAVNIGAPLSPEVSRGQQAQSSPSQRGSDERDELDELYAEHGWEYIDLNKVDDDDDDDQEEDGDRLESVPAGEAETTGVDRIREALYANTWPNFVRNDDRRRQAARSLEAVASGPQAQAHRDTSSRPLIGFSDSHAETDGDEQADAIQVGEQGGDEEEGQRAHTQLLRDMIAVSRGPHKEQRYGKLEDEDEEDGTGDGDRKEADDFGAFQEAEDGPSGNAAAIDTSTSTSAGAAATSAPSKSASTDASTWLSGSSGNKGGDTEDFSARFGPAPDPQAFFVSESSSAATSTAAAGESAEKARIGEDGDDENDEADDADEADEGLTDDERAILDSLSVSQGEIDALTAQFSSLAFPASTAARGNVALDDAGFEEVMQNMMSLRETISTHQTRIAGIEDPVAKRREAAMFSLAFTQFLTGHLGEEELTMLGEEMETLGPGSAAETAS